jgi:hypothetical protein
MLRLKSKNLLPLILWLVGIHSVGFGLSLIILPCSVIELFGFTLSQKFFATQGGVFHIIISYAYFRAARQPESNRELVYLSIFTKFMATIFLFSYYFLGDQILIVILSAFMDFFMGLAILAAYFLFTRAIRKESILSSDQSQA